MKEEIIAFLKDEIKSHPKLQPADIFKFVYQAVFGPMHLYNEKNQLEYNFVNEYNKAETINRPLVQKLSNKYCRIDFAAWKFNNSNPELLFNCFLESIHKNDTVSNKNDTVRQLFVEIINYINQNLDNFCFEFSKKEWYEIYNSYDYEKVEPISHSNKYKAFYLPSYRVVCIDLLNKYNIY